MGMSYNEPVTPIGGAYLQPQLNHVTYCIAGLQNPINIDALKNEFINSLVMKIPRFSSIPVTNPHDGSLNWEITQVNLDDHIFIHHGDDDDHGHVHDEPPMSKEDIVNSYLADMAISSPMSMDKPLWDVHIMQEQNCMIVRVHHALADGMSLLSAAWTIGRPGEVNGHDEQHNHVTMSKMMNGHSHDDGQSAGSKQKGTSNDKGGKSLKRRGLWEVLVSIWFTLVFGLKIIARCLWVKDKVNVISGIDGVELWPRKIATARFKVADMKAIKKAIPNATVHDVLYGILWCGLTKYLNVRYPKDMQDGAQITGLCPVNLRLQHGLQDLSNMPWGNKFAMILMPITYVKKGLDPLTYVVNAKTVMDQKKRSMEATFSYNVMKLGSKLFGSKVGGILFYNIFHNTTFLISNVVGPPEEISITGNPVTYLRATSSSQPQAITMHMVSYAGMADLQIQVAKEVIPDPKFLAKCFEDALSDMKEAAENQNIANT